VFFFFLSEMYVSVENTWEGTIHVVTTQQTAKQKINERIETIPLHSSCKAESGNRSQSQHCQPI